MTDDRPEPGPALRPVVARVAALNLGAFALEIVAALLIGSVALVADSVDFLEDAAINGLILAGLGWSARARARLGSALAFVLLAPALAAAVAAWAKWEDFVAPAALPLAATGLGAFAVNLACALMLARHRAGAGSLTRAAYLSARNDGVANLAVVAAGLVTVVYPSPWPDLIAAAGIALLNADSAADILRAAAAERRAAG